MTRQDELVMFISFCVSKQMAYQFKEEDELFSLLLGQTEDLEEILSIICYYKDKMKEIKKQTGGMN
jgi:hypothetical protein